MKPPIPPCLSNPRRELDAGELGADRLGHGFDEQRLGQPGHAFQQHVPVGQQGDEDALDEGGLADDLVGNGCLQVDDGIHFTVPV